MAVRQVIRDVSGEVLERPDPDIFHSVAKLREIVQVHLGRLSVNRTRILPRSRSKRRRLHERPTEGPARSEAEELLLLTHLQREGANGPLLDTGSDKGIITLNLRDIGDVCVGAFF